MSPGTGEAAGEAAGSRARQTWLALMPATFVLLWSTGFIGAKLGLPYTDPLTFLALRFAVVAALLLAAALALGVPWPESWTDTGHFAVAGLLVHGVYLGGVFSAIHHGVEAGVVALIVGIQPLLTAALARPLLRERVTPLQSVGLVLGIAGVTLVVWRKLSAGVGTPLGMGLAVLALVGITIGTLYQKRFCARMHLISGNVIQFCAAGAAITVLACAFEPLRVVWSGRFVFALAWLVLVLSVGAITLLYLLIRRGSAARVASLFYLVPPCTALIAWRLFGETFGALAMLGMVLAVIGVALVNVRR